MGKVEPLPPCLKVKRGREELLLQPNEKQGRRLGAEYPKPSLPWLNFSLPYQMVMERGSGWLWGSSHDATAVVGCRVHKREAGEGLGAEKPEIELWWLGFGHALQNGNGGDGRRWWYGADEAVVVVGPCVRKHELGEGVWGRKPETEHTGSVSGCVCANTAEIGCCTDTATHCTII